MKSSLPDINHWLVLGIGILTGIVYRDSFVSPFFQDDKTLLIISRTKGWFDPIANYPYRPIANNLFYGLGQAIFGTDVRRFHFVLFVSFAATLFILFHLSRLILKDKRAALATVFFYALNISLFANFYWVATSYFVLGSLFFFLTCLLYLLPGSKAFIFGVISFVLALGCNEIAFTLPLLLSILSWYLHTWQKRLTVFWMSLFFLFPLRIFIAGFPRETDYTVVFNTQIFATVRWYLLRSLNLPEGIRGNYGMFIFGIWVIFMCLLAITTIVAFKERKLNFRLAILGLGFFAFGALPFYFLPNHMSSYYLTISLFGTSLILGEVFRGKILFIALMVYFVLTVAGLSYLSHTHWIILKNTGPIGQFTSF